jgi:hypothetical protein
MNLARAVTLGSESFRTQNIFYCFIWDPSILEGQFLYSPGTGWPSYTPGHWGPFFVVTYGSQGYGGGASQSQSHITTESQSASPACYQTPIWDPRPIFFFLEIFFRQLRVYFVAPSLMRRRVYNLLLLLGFASAVPRDSKPYFIVPILETPPTWKARSPYLIPQEQSGPDILAGLRRRYSDILTLLNSGPWAGPNPKHLSVAS